MNKKSTPARFFVLPLIISLFFSFLFQKAPLLTCYATPYSDTVFLGDSTTNSLRFWKILPEDSVWTGDKCTLSMWDVSQKKIALSEGSLSSLKELPDFEIYSKNLSVAEGKTVTYFLPLADLAALKKPKNIIITLGINGAALMSENDFKEEYTLLIHTLKKASPSTGIFLNSIFPVAGHAKIKKETIDLANTWIKDVASEERLPFLDTNSLLKNEYGEADPALVDSVDGIHWNKRGCQKILEVLKIAIQKYLPSPLSPSDFAAF